MKKIIVIGANQTGLVFAGFAAAAGYDVSVFEAQKRENVAYDWTDDMQPSTFRQIGLPMPPENTYVMKNSVMTFLPPNKKSHLLLVTTDDKNDIAVSRRPFNAWLEERAISAGASVIYSSPVSQAIVENNAVVGVKMENGEAIRCDFVVDCAGARSCVRDSLPEQLHIPAKLNPSQAFFTRRTFFAIPHDAPKPEFSDKLYLKHREESGISWCRISHDHKCADVLVGRIGGLSDAVHENAITDLRLDNPVIGSEVVTGGELTVIPVRHPISRMFANGYALVGDSAFMTIPMIGSGMASGMVAAKILFDVISKPVGEPFSAENLYRYQKQFMKEIGAGHAAIDIIKCWLLDTRVGDVDFLIGSGFLSEELMNAVNGTNTGGIPASTLVKTVIRGVKKPAVLAGLAKKLLVMGKQNSLAASMPEKYDDSVLSAWQQKYEKAYQ